VCCQCVQALQQWHGLQQQWCRAAPLSTSQQLEAAEAAAWLLQRLATQQAVQQLLLDDEIEQLQQDREASIATARQQLDDLAAAVKAAAPDAFLAGDLDGGLANHMLYAFLADNLLHIVSCKLQKAGWHVHRPGISC
jgi:hypothetical protein